MLRVDCCMLSVTKSRRKTAHVFAYGSGPEIKPPISNFHQCFDCIAVENTLGKFGKRVETHTKLPVNVQWMVGNITEVK